ncbi:MAG: spoIIIJ-associated protein [Actinomycetota bacterium]|nr:spoIIIJ-associated protein [Actinomycetota bacterium]MDQ1476557.1 spoIIIJ-associated protein [Actinomycetota bacterium]
MDWIEVTARTVDDAKELALDRLGVVEEELEVEIVDEPRRGILGMGRGDARIRARVKPISREKPSDRKRRRRPNERTGGGGGGGQGGGGRGGGSRGRSGERPRDTSPKGDADDSQEANQPREANPTSARAPGSGGARRRRGGRGRGTGGGAARVATPSSDERSAEADDKVEAEVDVETVPVTDQAEHAAKFTDELVRTMGFSASVRTEIDEDDVTVRIEGDGLGALVGPRGATIQALEEVVRAVVQHHAGGHSAWIHVDVAGYRERRRQALAEFARQVAAEVKQTGEERAMEPMGAADRKVVHDTISDIDGVDTTSEGEDPRRRVVVLPA